MLEGCLCQPSLALLEEALTKGEEASLSATESFYMVRAAYRFLPEFVAQGDYRALLELFDAHQEALGYSAAPLRARMDPHWARALEGYLHAYGPDRRAESMAATYSTEIAPEGSGAILLNRTIAPGLRLDAVRVTPDRDGWGKVQLVFACTAPLERDWKVYLHGLVPPEKRAAMPPDKRKLGFFNWDVGVTDPPASTWHEYPYVVLTLYVPQFALANTLNIGLHADGAGAYGAAVSVPLSPPEPGQVVVPTVSSR